MKRSVNQLIPKPLQFLVGREGLHHLIIAMESFAAASKPRLVPISLWSAYVHLETAYCQDHHVLAVEVVTPFGNVLRRMTIKIDVLTTSKGKKRQPSKSKKNVTK